MSSLDAAKRQAIASAYLREPSSAVAARFGVHQSTVIRVCHEFDLVKRAGAGGIAFMERRREVRRLRGERLTLEEIGERLGGISKQRVSQILNPPAKVRRPIVVGSGVKWPRRAAGEEYWRRGVVVEAVPAGERPSGIHGVWTRAKKQTFIVQSGGKFYRPPADLLEAT